MKPDALHLKVLPLKQRKLWEKLKLQSKIIHSLGFYLAGGTGLSLQLGHRQSVDFDFFSVKKDVGRSIRSWLEGMPKYVLREANADTVHAQIDNVKVSFIGAYRYPTVGRLINSKGVRIANVLDIGLMKLLAITHRATLRDYIDLAAIIRGPVSLPELIKASRKKYGASFNPMISLRALVSFEDVDPEMPALIDRRLSVSWKQILKEAVKSIA